MTSIPDYKIFPLGDSALTIDFGNTINECLNDTVISIFNSLQQNPFEGLIESVPAYSSLTIYYDISIINKIIKNESTVFHWIKNKVNEQLQQKQVLLNKKVSTVSIPVCYDKKYAPDLEWMSEHIKISCEEIIQLHCDTTYRVFMLGFLPGFAYMGTVNNKIEAPRKQKPQNVSEGSVGIAGKQTGIYPLSSPGGWQIIGRTPLKLFNKKEGNTLLNPGDSVRFYSINKDEFDNIESRNS
ncbi:MAG: 5-oxoprolinase subunit PxpB [Chitinophagaceae bacterium]|nr:MAG: 5-oxoprolinase subunit PxpB [Chitinophagaceae bacterium]